MRSPVPASTCFAGEDLTAFAHGGLDGATRAAVSRHLLVCAACRARQAADRDLLRRLGDLGPEWRTYVRSGDAARAPRVWHALLAGAAVAAVFLATFLVPWAPAGGPSGPAERADRTDAFAGEISALLASQRPDGSWPADEHLGGPRADEGATALALLALLPQGAASLEAGPRARAVAEATRWLLARERDAGRDPRSRAVTTAALVALAEVTEDAGLRASVGPSLRRLARDVHAFPDDPVALRWAYRALLTARAAGWERLDVPLRHLGARIGADRDLAPWARSRPDATSEAASACAVALRLLAGRGAGTADAAPAPRPAS